jgi:hypothetical protein
MHQERRCDAPLSSSHSPIYAARRRLFCTCSYVRAIDVNARWMQIVAIEAQIEELREQLEETKAVD